MLRRVPSELDAATAELMLQIVDHAPDGVAVVDRHGVVVLCNHTMAQLVGVAKEDMTGRSIDELVPSPQRSSHVAQRTAFVHEGGARPMGLGRSLHLARADGGLIPVEVGLSTITVDDNSFTVAAVRDVTQRLRTEDELRQANDLLMVANERERIARDLHDTVLQRLFGLGLDLQALEMQAPPTIAPRITHAVDEIDRVVREIRTLVFTLGSTSREGSFGRELGTVIAQASRLLGYTPHARVEGLVEAVVPAAVRVEMMATLREALSNVARHAKATVVEVEIVAGDTLSLVVSDNGIGPADTAEPPQGNGLGNMNERARLLGGEFEAAAGPSGGMQVRWTVPLRDPGLSSQVDPD
jgi:two-component system, NarL family, sensor histidine kinase DevS